MITPPGHYRRMAAFLRRPRKRLLYAGDWLTGSTIEGAVRTGVSAAEQILKAETMMPAERAATPRAECSAYAHPGDLRCIRSPARRSLLLLGYVALARIPHAHGAARRARAGGAARPPGADRLLDRAGELVASAPDRRCGCASDLEFASTLHFRTGCAHGRAAHRQRADRAVDAPRRRRPRATIHPWLGAAAVLLAAAHVVTGLRIMP